MALLTFPFMTTALSEARDAALAGEVPVGAVIVDPSGKIIAKAGNRVLRDKDPTAHAELLAIREAAQLLETERLIDCDLWVTLEPCAMCAQAIAFARIKRLYFGALDPKGGGTRHGARIFNQHTTHHRPEIYQGIREAECAQILNDFFKDRRGKGEST